MLLISLLFFLYRNKVLDGIDNTEDLGRGLMLDSLVHFAQTKCFQ